MKPGNFLFQAEVIDSAAMIEEACALLFRVYIDHMSWNFAPDNPSKIRAERKNERMLLLDRFTTTARWFGMFDGEKLIGCARLHGLDGMGLYEIEGYESSECIRAYLPRENCVEMGKVAVDPAYKHHRVVNQIYLSVFEYCQRNHYSVFGAVANQHIKNLFHRVELHPTVEHAFKYEESDSCPVSFYFVDYERGDFKTIIPNLSDTLCPNKSAQSVMDALETVAPLLPLPAYWMDREGQVLGANDLCLKAMGAARHQIIGKKPHDFYPPEIADHILSHNNFVMRNEEIGGQNETIRHLKTNEFIYAKALKVPLYDQNANVIGIVGTSIDLTAEKEAEQLKIEKERQTTMLEEKEHFNLIARKFAHDIASPLTSLKILAPLFKDAQPKEAETFQRAVDHLIHISQELLHVYRAEKGEERWKEEKREISLFPEVRQIIEEKQLQNPQIYFRCIFPSNRVDCLITIQPTQFRRALSNLLNNAIDAVKNKPDAMVRVYIEVKSDKTILFIRDNGHGMPMEVIQRLLSGEKVTQGKEKGNGMGMQQVWDLLTQNDGKIYIKSECNLGTQIEIHLKSENIIKRAT